MYKLNGIQNDLETILSFRSCTGLKLKLILLLALHSFRSLQPYKPLSWLSCSLDTSIASSNTTHWTHSVPLEPIVFYIFKTLICLILLKKEKNYMAAWSTSPGRPSNWNILEINLSCLNSLLDWLFDLSKIFHLMTLISCPARDCVDHSVKLNLNLNII